MSTTSVTTRTINPTPRRRNRNTPQRTSVTRVVQNSNRQRAIRRRRGLTRTAMGPVLTVEDKWLKALNDPFEHGPVKLGIGTLVPTVVSTAYVRTTLTANADGSLAIFLIPAVGSVNAPIYYNNSGFSSTTWTSLGFVNSTAISQQMNECRVIAGGLRALPLVAATAAPGICYSGSIPDAYAAYLTSNNIGGASSSTALTPSLAPNGAVATMRPQDPDSFTFQVSNVQGPLTSVNGYWSYPMIVFTGLPASTSVMIEAVLHVEGLPGVNVSSVQSTMDARASEQSGPSLHQTVESMYNYIRPRLLPPSMATFALEQLQQAAQRIGVTAGNTVFNLAANHIRNNARNRFLSSSHRQLNNAQSIGGYLRIEEVD